MTILFSSLSGDDCTQSQHYKNVLERLGHLIFEASVPTHLDHPTPRFWIEKGYSYEITIDSLIRSQSTKPDFFLYVEPHGLIPRGLDQSPIPTVCVLCDTHQWLEGRLNLAKFFDHVFLYHRNYVKYFTAHPKGNVHWQPYACDLDLFKPLGCGRDLDVAFVGQLGFRIPRRSQVLAELARRYRVNEQRFHMQKEIPSVYSRAKIVLNMPLKDDLNFRTFEAMSCGAMLLTRRVNNGQEVLFKEGEHYAAYADDREMYEKIDYYLSHPAEREAIAAAGLAEVQKKHRLEQRVEEILEQVKQKPEPVAPIRRMSPAQVDREYAWLYEYWKVAEPGLRLIRNARRSKRPWLHLVPPAARTILRILFR